MSKIEIFMASGVLILIRNGPSIRRPGRFSFVLLVHYEKKADVVNGGFTVFRWKSKGIFRDSSHPVPSFKSMFESPLLRRRQGTTPVVKT